MGVATWGDRRADRFELHLGEAGYPSQLQLSPDPPDTIYGIGNPESLRVGLAIVGARKATPYGITCAGAFAGWAATCGYTIISGGAVGCDQSAHRGALEQGGCTVAVLGCGANVTYPSGAGSLLNHVASSGAVISELPWGHPPLKWAFRKRNRIIAGLCAGLLVVEARLPSGTFSTAEYALDAGRDVMAVPGSVFAPECRGPNRLIRQGAIPIADMSDLAMELERLIGPAIGPSSHDQLAIQADDPLLAALLADPMRPDDVAVRLNLDVVAVARRIGSLEAASLIERYPDGRYGPGRQSANLRGGARYNAT
jgi:DNA processing protein